MAFNFVALPNPQFGLALMVPAASTYPVQVLRTHDWPLATLRERHTKRQLGHWERFGKTLR